MKRKAKPQGQAAERSLFQRYAPAIAVLVVFTIIITAIVGTIKVIQREAAHRPVVVAEDLPGPKNQISQRSKEQLVTMSQEYPHILAVAVTRYHYKKNENLFAYAWAKTPAVKKVLDKIIDDLNKRQTGPNAMSSDEVAAMNAKNPERAARMLRNSEEARLGLIKCVPISEATLTYNELRTITTGICYASIPPFEAAPAMGIIMLTDSKLTEYSELAEMRRILLALQIDIYNRDFKGRETWAHP